MIISRSPLRVSLFGGGTDLPAWYVENGGLVINLAINKYNFITIRRLPEIFDYKYRVRYYQREETQSLDEIKHPVVREAIRWSNLTEGLDIVHHSDLPNRSGLGSSSSFTVGLLNAIYAYKGRYCTKKELANLAIDMEQNRLKEAVGSQDQIAAAFGGVNSIRFGGSNNFIVEPLNYTKAIQEDFENRIVIVFSGFARFAAPIEKKKIENIVRKKKEFSALGEICEHALKEFSKTTLNWNEICRLLNEQWNLKKSLADEVSNENLDSLVNKGLKLGAGGCKLLGAGGGGFMLFLVDPDNQDKFIKKMSVSHHAMKLRVDNVGSTIVYYSHQDE